MFPPSVPPSGGGKYRRPQQRVRVLLIVAAVLAAALVGALIAVLSGHGGVDGRGGNTAVSRISVSLTDTGGCVVKHGNAYCWGERSGVTPKKVLGLGHVTAIAGGGSDALACAVSDGDVLCWSGVDNRDRPTRISGVSNANAVTVGINICAIAQAMLYCGSSPAWSEGDPGGMVRVSGLTDVTEAVVGRSEGCAIANRSLYCWPVDSDFTGGEPQKVESLSNVTDIAISRPNSGYETICAIADSVPYCWGENFNEVTGRYDQDTSQPGPVDGLASATRIQPDRHSCAISEGKLFCWGSHSGSLIDTSELGHDVGYKKLRQVSSLTGLTDFGIGLGQTCVVVEDRDLYCWGDRANPGGMFLGKPKKVEFG